MRLDCLTKIVAPKRPAGTVRRRRLLDVLHQHIDRRLQIVSGGAGYGKTTLLTDFAQDVDITICWYTLDRFDSDPKVFLETLVEAIAHKFPQFGSETRGRIALVADFKQEMPALVRLLTAEIHRCIPEYFALVLDDYHQVETSPTINSLLEYLIERLPDNCQLIVSSRSGVPFPSVAKMLSQQQAYVLTTEDLRFTVGETSELSSERYGQALREEDAQLLNDQCEGWVTALQLMISALGTGRPGPQKLVKSTHLFDYLNNEVFLKQTQRMRRFLLGTSVLSELEPEVCDYLLGTKGSARILREIEGANVFVSRLGEDGSTYRYHQLFQDFLQKKLMEAQDQYTSLMVKAALFYEQRGNREVAFEYYQRCQRWKEYLRVLLHTGEELAATGRWESLARWTDVIPAEHLAREPQLLVWRAQAAMRLGEMDKAISLSAQALGEFELQGITSGMAQASLVRASALRLAGQSKAALKDVQRALKWLKGDDSHLRLVAEARRQLGAILYEDGQFEKAAREWKKSLDSFTKLGDLSSISKLNEFVGVACAELGDFPKAMGYLEQSRAGWQKLGNLSELGQTLNNLGNLHYLLGSYVKALTLLKEAVDTDEKSGNLRSQAWALWNIGDVRRDMGDGEAALANYQKSLEIARQVMDSRLVGYVTCSLGTVKGIQGKFDEAELLIKQAISHAEEKGSKYEQGLHLGWLGALYCWQGKRKRSLQLLDKSVALVSGSKNKRKEAWARLHLANAFFLNRRFAQCLRELIKVAAILDGVGYDAFLVADAARMPSLIRYAASKRVGDGRFSEIWQKVQKPQGAYSEAAEVAPNEKVKALPKVDAYSLGQSLVLVDGRKVSELEWRSKKSRELFFYLLSHRRQGTKEQVLEALWPDIAGPQSHSSLYSTAYRLRRALYDGCLVQEGGRYYLCPEGEVWFDAEEFEKLVSQASQTDRGSEKRASLLEKAVNLYRGSFLEEFYSEWCETLRKNLEQRHINALANLGGYYAARGDYAKSVSFLERIVGIDNYREETYAELMKSYTRIGDTTAALKWYQRYRELFQDDPQLSPSSTLAQLYNEILEVSLKHS
ncbi:MAG: tetratricopeptide repeat protein [Chloroflexi bacterium]|nr:tetratricopeptide repeat protein [Chloroflexota bacterium]